MNRSSATIAKLEQTPGALLVWLDGVIEPLELPWFWVKDHSQDPTSVDHGTLQRTVDSFAIDMLAGPKRCELSDGEILVHWEGDGPPSLLPPSLLTRLIPTAPTRRLWHSGEQPRWEPIPYDEVLSSDAGLRRWVEAIDRSGFGLVSGTPGDIESVIALVDRVGYVRRTIFGDVWALSSDEVDHADSAYSTTYLEPHSDGTYAHDGPGLQLFACVERSGTGGDSILVDGFAAAETLRRADPEAFRLLTEVAVPGHYIEDGVELRARRPTIVLGAGGHIEQVSFNNYDRSAFLLPPTEMTRWFLAYRALHDLIVDEDRWWTHRLEPGETLLFDNWRCLHGRLAYSGRRRFHGCYLNHEDLESRIRVLGR